MCDNDKHIMKQSSDEIDLSPFFKWLGSPQGHEVLSRVLSMFEDIKKVTTVPTFL